MSSKKTQTLYHPAFPDTSVEVEGADRIREHLAQGWLEQAPKPAPNQDAATAPTAPAPAE